MKLKRTVAALILCASGSANAECMIGELTTFAGDFVPRGYAEADGRLLSVAQFPSLFAIMGTRYGGDGSTTFALPNIQNGLTHQPATTSPSASPVVLKTLVCIAGEFPTQS